MKTEWYAVRPIAHRGLHDAAEFPENTLPAFKRAVEHGIPFECDVQLTAGGQLAIVHDADLEHLTGDRVRICDLDREALRRVRIGKSGERVPVLADVLEVAGGRVPIMIDVRRWRAERSARLEHAVAAEVSGYNGPVALQSFDPLAVFRLRRLLRQHPAGQISGRLRSVGRAAAALARTMITNVVTRPAFISYELAELPSPFVSAWRRLSIPVVAWTAHSAADEKRAAAEADNFFFSGYQPLVYRDVLSGRAR